jgi:hypothetical protein
MKKNQNNLIIDVLKFGMDKFYEPNLKKKDVEDFLISKKYKIDADLEEKIKQIIYNYFVEENNNIQISLDSYFKLIEYIELEESRKSSKSAKRWAILAIILNVIALIISLSVSFYLNTKPIKLNENQLTEILNTIKLNP